MKFKKKYKLFLLFILIISIYIAAIPRILYIKIPCLDTFHTSSVDYANCNIVLVSNYYIILGLVGFFVSLFSFTLITNLKLKFETVILGLIYISIFLVSYYTYLPVADSMTTKTNIFLDTLNQDYGSMTK